MLNVLDLYFFAINGRGTGRVGLPLALLLLWLMDVCQSVRHFKMLHVSDLSTLFLRAMETRRGPGRGGLPLALPSPRVNGCLVKVCGDILKCCTFRTCALIAMETRRGHGRTGRRGLPLALLHGLMDG
jgi:hypothetical protein